MRLDADTVPEYVALVPEARRPVVAMVCARLRAEPDVEETLEHGMPFYKLRDAPFIAVASQKHHVSLYVVGLDETLSSVGELADALAGIGRGKNCLRFRDSQLERLTEGVLEAVVDAALAWSSPGPR